MKRTRMLAVGMLPPPFGGQSIMFQRAVDGLQPNYDLTVIDTQFQKNLGESGSFSMRKVWIFVRLLLLKLMPLFFKARYDVLYYCLSGPSTFGVLKDLIFLIPLRARARKTVYHIHGAGGVKYLLQCNIFIRAWT